MTDTEAIAAARSGIEAWKAGQGTSPLAAVCPIRGVLDKLGDKWSMLVILELSAGERRFSELKRQIPDISQKMLTQTLRVLQRDGLVARAVHPTVPPAVSYDLTAMGKSLLPPFGALVAWADEHHPAITSAREAFDAEAA
jgi:DNA-binding HxlR family transcriptional regulator